MILFPPTYSIRTRRTDVFIESGPNAGKERAEFESAGGPERDAPGWNPHRGTPDTGLNGGRPDSGRFSRGGPEHAK